MLWRARAGGEARGCTAGTDANGRPGGVPLAALPAPPAGAVCVGSDPSPPPAEAAARGGGGGAVGALLRTCALRRRAAATPRRRRIGRRSCRGRALGASAASDAPNDA